MVHLQFFSLIYVLKSFSRSLLSRIHDNIHLILNAPRSKFKIKLFNTFLVNFLVLMKVVCVRIW